MSTNTRNRSEQLRVGVIWAPSTNPGESVCPICSRARSFAPNQVSSACENQEGLPWQADKNKSWPDWKMLWRPNPKVHSSLSLNLKEDGTRRDCRRRKPCSKLLAPDDEPELRF